MAKNRNQNRDRTAAPSQGAAAPGDREQATTRETPPQSPAGSGMSQEMSPKRKKKFGHN